MENKKQTAVEFAVNKLANLIPSGNQILIRAILIEAKKIEKQQIIDAWNDGNCNTDLKGYPSANYAISAEHYYTQELRNSKK